MSIKKFSPTKEQISNFSICIDNEIRIYPVAIANSDKYYVEVDRRGKKMLSSDKNGEPIEYTDIDAWNKIFEYYEYFAKNR